MTKTLDRRRFMQAMGLGAAALAMGQAGCVRRVGRSGPPNIVLLFADDMGYGDLSCYGHPTIRTPNLDGLADDGIRLTSFYVSAAGCSPSRASLMTGRYPLRAGLPNVLGPESKSGLPPDEVVLAEPLKAIGYRTMCIGKWHLGHAEEKYLPTSNGFDEYFGLLYSNDMKPPFVRTDIPLQLYRNSEPIEGPVDQTTLTTRYTEEAVKFIHSAGDTPFFLYLPYSMPHLPIHTAERFRGQSLAGLYGDVIETIDWSVGQILNELDAQGIADNTIVIFTSDNGPWVNLPDRMLQDGNEPWHVGSPGPLKGAKGNTYEGGMREPCIIRWPGVVSPEQVSAEMATSMDLYVSLIRAAGGQLPSDRKLDGNDINAFLRGEEESPTRSFCYFHGKRLEAFRDGKWKYRRSHQRSDGERSDRLLVELYDLEFDPGERFNLIDRYPETGARMEARLRVFAGEMDAGVWD